jgi:AcrR family transcriptional regulator
MKLIAEEAGVSRSLLHFHFKSKEDLFISAINRMAASLFDVAYQRISSSETPSQILSEATELLYELFTSDAKVTTFMVEFTAAANHSDFLRKAYLEYRQAQREMLTNLILQIEQDLPNGLPFQLPIVVQLIETILLGMSMQRPFAKSKKEFREIHNSIVNLITANALTTEP